MSTDLSGKQLRNVRIGAALPSAIWLGLWIYTVITNNDQAALYYALLLILPIGLIFLTTIWLFVRLGTLSGWSPAGLIRGWREGKPMLWETGSFFLIITLTALASLVLIMLRARVADQVTLMVLFIALEKPATDTGVHCLNGALRIVPFCSGGNEYTPRVSVGQSHAIIEWSDTDSGAFISRLTLNSDGRFSFAYDRLPTLPSLGRNFQIGFSTQDAPLPQSLSFDDLPFVTSVGALWFDLTLMHRQTLDSVYLPVFGFMIGVSFLNAFLVLWWVNTRVRRPLARTHEALEGIRQGILNNNLGAANYDEFSDLAESFGRMEEQLRNLRSGQDEITDAIEAELKARHVDKSIEAKLPEAVSADQQLLERILDVVEKSSDQTNFQVLDLAEAVGLSTRQLHRKVLDLAGVTPLTLIRTTRLKKARRILEKGGSTVSQAAFGSGFRDLAYFSKLYRKEFGELPSRTASSKA